MPKRNFQSPERLPMNGKQSLEERIRKQTAETQARLYTRQEVRLKLEDMSRSPFTDFLALLLGAHPTEQNVIDFASRNPDKWAQTVASFARMSGYHDELEVRHTLFATVQNMSDMDVEKQMRALTRQIGDSYLVDPATVIDQPRETPLEQTARGPTRTRAIANPNGPKGKTF